MPNLFLYIQTVLFQRIQFRISVQFKYNRVIGLMSSVFANGSGRPGFGHRSCYTKDSKNGI